MQSGLERSDVMSKLALNGGEPLKKTCWPKWPQAGELEKEELISVIDGFWSYNGPKETAFKEVWSGFIGAKRTYLVANGTVSLQLILEALDIGYGDEVIVPGITWQATACCALDVNAVPVLVDVCEDSWCIDPDKIEEAITPRTRAVIITHLYGTICDMDAILEITDRYNLFLIEDAAHQHGSVFKGKKVGTFGIANSFSLQNSKVLTCGEGGIITTDDEALGEKIDALRNCGRRPVDIEKYSKETGNYVSEGDLIQSGNYRITEFQAAVLLAQFKLFEAQTSLREENALYLRSLLEEIDGISNLRRQDGTGLQAYFNFAFNYDSSKFDGLPVGKFRQALTEEMNYLFTESYEPLNKCCLYTPLTKKRYRISKEHLAAIDCSRFELPVSERVFNDISVCAHHTMLMGTKSDMDLVAEAILKIKENVQELL